MRESCTSGSVRGASSDRRLYSTLWRAASLLNWTSGDASSVGTSPHGPGRLLPFVLRTPQRNRNELGETTVNKT
jgi:hypothetical protein